MSVKLTNIDSGQAGWDKTTMTNLKSLLAGLDGKITDTGWVEDGFNLINGFAASSSLGLNMPGYRVYSVDGVQKVLLLKGSLVTSPDISAPYSTFMNVPAVFKSFFNSNPNIQATWFGFTDKLQPINFHVGKDRTYLELTTQAVDINKLGRIQLNTVFVA